MRQPRKHDKIIPNEPSFWRDRRDGVCVQGRIFMYMTVFGTVRLKFHASNAMLILWIFIFVWVLDQKRIFVTVRKNEKSLAWKMLEGKQEATQCVLFEKWIHYREYLFYERQEIGSKTSRK